jgi:lipopolysaccharide export system protein LptA
MRAVVLSLLLVITLFAKDKIEIVSDYFEADENALMSKFVDNVHVKRAKDRLNADTLTIYFDSEKKPIKMIATGNADAELYTDKSHYKGYADTIIYKPNEKQYRFEGNAHLHDITSDKNVYGDIIVTDQLGGTYNVHSGKSEPVKFLFTVE